MGGGGGGIFGRAYIWGGLLSEFYGISRGLYIFRILRYVVYINNDLVKL